MFPTVCYETGLVGLSLPTLSMSASSLVVSATESSFQVCELCYEIILHLFQRVYWEHFFASRIECIWEEGTYPVSIFLVVTVEFLMIIRIHLFNIKI